MATLAVSEASRLREIGFPEFTTKLVTDVFNALIGANLRQTESYMALLNTVSNSVSAYINETKDDISGHDILMFLSRLLPPDNPTGNSEDATRITPKYTLTGDDVKALKESVAVEGEVPPKTTEKLIPAAGGLTPQTYNDILTAVARRLAANKYDMLKEMVKLGILRLVVENGIIETRITFNTYTNLFSQSRSTYYNRNDYNFRKNSGTGFLVSLFANASSSTTQNTVTISTAEKIDQDRSGTSINIFGMVRINFRTDYMPVNA